jgi:hypothetical protein
VPLAHLLAGRLAMGFLAWRGSLARCITRGGANYFLDVPDWKSGRTEHKKLADLAEELTELGRKSSSGIGSHTIDGRCVWTFPERLARYPQIERLTDAQTEKTNAGNSHHGLNGDLLIRYLPKTRGTGLIRHEGNRK